MHSPTSRRSLVGCAAQAPQADISTGTGERRPPETQPPGEHTQSHLEPLICECAWQRLSLEIVLCVLLTQPRTKTASFIAREGGVGLVGERTRFNTGIF